METDLIIGILIGLLVGIIAGFLLLKNSIAKGFVPRSTYELLEGSFKEIDVELKQKRIDILALTEQVTGYRETEKNLNDKIMKFNEELIQREAIVKEQFKNLATEILKEKSTDFIDKNKESLDKLLTPLQKDITDFKKAIEDTQKESIRDITSLKKDLEHMNETSVKLSEGTIKLTNALNAEAKVQGDWGEDRLNLIFEQEGLVRHIDYSSQSALRDADSKLKKPDFIIKLPQNRCIIVDSKVTLTSYSDYVNAGTPEEKKVHLKRMVDSIKNHIEHLSSKEYQNLPGLETLDFVIMFVPIEPALTFAVYDSPEIYKMASDKRVVMLTPTTLLPIAKVIKQLWDNENRIANIENIFKKVGYLYDKFKGFVDDMSAIQKNIQGTQEAYDNAMNKLTLSVKKGDTVIGRFEELTTMGVKVKNQIDVKIVQEIEKREGTYEITALNGNQTGEISEAQVLDEEKEEDKK